MLATALSIVLVAGFGAWLSYQSRDARISEGSGQASAIGAPLAADATATGVTSAGAQTLHTADAPRTAAGEAFVVYLVGSSEQAAFMRAAGLHEHEDVLAAGTLEEMERVQSTIRQLELDLAYLTSPWWPLRVVDLRE